MMMGPESTSRIFQLQRIYVVNFWTGFSVAFQLFFMGRWVVAEIGEMVGNRPPTPPKTNTEPENDGF